MPNYMLTDALCMKSELIPKLKLLSYWARTEKLPSLDWADCATGAGLPDLKRQRPWAQCVWWVMIAPVRGWMDAIQCFVHAMCCLYNVLPNGDLSFQGGYG